MLASAAALLPARAAYLDHVQTWTDQQIATHYSRAQIDALTAGTGALPDTVAWIAATEARLWLLGGTTNSAYADNSLAALKAYVAQWRRAKNAGLVQKIGFQAKEPFLEAYEILTTNGIGTTDAAFLADVKTMAAESMGPGRTIGTSNADAFDIAGTTLALKLWPDLDPGGEWLRYVKSVWGAWAECHDTTENSLIYNSLYLQMLILAAQHANDVPALREENFLAQLQGAGARATFTRYRDQITGTGTAPIYGDDGGGSDLIALDAWPNVFEWAGAQWKDGTFRWAAAREFDFARHGKMTPLYLYLMTYADAWSNAALAPVAPRVGSALLTRVTKQNPRTPDQLVLASDREPRSPFFATTLSIAGGHAHDAQIGAVSLYQVNGTVFLRGLGYDCSTSAEASLFLINKPSQAFPWRGMPREDTWYEAQIPTAALDTVTEASNPNAGKTVIDRPEWRWETRDRTGSGTAWISHVRLVAADGAETMLSATDDATGWPKGTSVTDGPQPGTKALQFVAGPNVSGNTGTVDKVPEGQAFGRFFDPAQFPYVRFDWKAHSAVPFDQQICIFRENYGPLYQGASAWDQIYTPTVTAHVEPGALGAYGEYTMKNYMGLGDTLERRMVQLRDGTMVVQDTITAAAGHDGNAAGPVWQTLASATPTPIGDHAYDASGFFNSITRTTGDDHLLVEMEAAPGRTYGAALPPEPLWGRQTPAAIFAMSHLQKGVPCAFVTVLEPHAGSVDAAKLAAGISIKRADSGGVLVIIPQGATRGAMQVELAPHGAWKITAR